MKTNHEEQRKELGKVLKQIRESKGITLYRIEKETAIRFETLKAIESGSLRYNIDTFLTYINFLGVSIFFKE